MWGWGMTTWICGTATSGNGNSRCVILPLMNNGSWIPTATTITAAATTCIGHGWRISFFAVLLLLLLRKLLALLILGWGSGLDINLLNSHQLPITASTTIKCCQNILWRRGINGIAGTCSCTTAIATAATAFCTACSKGRLEVNWRRCSGC